MVFHDTINLPWPVGDPGQIWQRGFENTDGYFSLQIANSSLFLTATGVDTQQIQGNNVYYIVINHKVKNQLSEFLLVMTCQDKWKGPNCDQKTCPGKPPCTNLNQGKCNDYPDYNTGFPRLTCKCLEGWTGESCSEMTCPGKNSKGYSNPCSDHGTCGDDNRCICTDAYKGDGCSEDKPNSTTELPPTPNIKPLTNFQNGLQCNTKLLNLSILVFLIPAYV